MKLLPLFVMATTNLGGNESAPRGMGTTSSTAKNSGGNNSPIVPFLPYKPGMDVGELDEWPLTNPKSNYVIHEGNPKTFGRIDSSTQTTRVGIWKCTHGKLECTEQGDEFFTILKGSVEITYVDDPKQTMTLSTGDSMFISANGRRVIWNILDDDVTKVFYGCKMDGY